MMNNLHSCVSVCDHCTLPWCTGMLIFHDKATDYMPCQHGKPRTARLNIMLSIAHLHHHHHHPHHYHHHHHNLDLLITKFLPECNCTGIIEASGRYTNTVGKLSGPSSLKALNRDGIEITSPTTDLNGEELSR